LKRLNKEVRVNIFFQAYGMNGIMEWNEWNGMNGIMECYILHPEDITNILFISCSC
jgi:hypothetical protein